MNSVALMNGCFDILHQGHFGLLTAAEMHALAHSLRLTIALNTDDSVRRLKGAGRPVNPWHVRSANLRLFMPHVQVVPFGGNVLALAESYNPAVILRGYDQEIEPEIAAKFRVIRMPKFGDFSTTKCLESFSLATK